MNYSPLCRLKMSVADKTFLELDSKKVFDNYPKQLK